MCAVNAATAACDLPAGARMVMLQATTIAGLHADIAAVAAATGVAPRGVALSARIEAQLGALAGAPSIRATVVTVEWGDPPFLGGHWVPELVHLAGGEHLLSAAGDASRRSTWEEIAAVDPDLIVFLPCGYHLREAAAEAERLVELPTVRRLRAVQAGRFWATNATALFSRCTPAIVDAASTLAAIVRGEAPDPRAAVAIAPGVIRSS